MNPISLPICITKCGMWLQGAVPLQLLVPRDPPTADDDELAAYINRNCSR
jgi:hypothetical protein